MNFHIMCLLAHSVAILIQIRYLLFFKVQITGDLGCSNDTRMGTRTLLRVPRCMFSQIEQVHHRFSQPSLHGVHWNILQWSTVQVWYFLMVWKLKNLQAKQRREKCSLNFFCSFLYFFSAFFLPVLVATFLLPPLNFLPSHVFTRRSHSSHMPQNFHIKLMCMPT